MDRAPNKLREKLTAGQCATGAAIFSWSPQVVDAAGLAGLDYIRIDTEHAWRQDGGLEHLIRAAIMASVVPTRIIAADAVALFEAAENEYPALTSPSRYRNPLAPSVAASSSTRVSESALNCAGRFNVSVVMPSASSRSRVLPSAGASEAAMGSSLRADQWRRTAE